MNIHRFHIQILAIGLLVISLVINLTRDRIRKRLRIISQEDTPDLSKRSLLCIPCLCLVSFLCASFISSTDEFNPLISGILITTAAVLFFWFILLAVRGSFLIKHASFYRGTLARSFPPIVACSLLIFTCSVLPYLKAKETQWIQQDTLSIIPQRGMLSQLEQKTTDKLKQILLTPTDTP